ncbi:GNAT family N-acetyltransferase [Streptomyces sp. NPDC001948]
MQYSGVPPPCDAPRPTPHADPPGITGQPFDTTTSRLLTAHLDGQLAGWLCLRRDPWALISHWGTLHHVQTRTAMRGQGIGNALMNEVRRIARDEMDLEQLRLAARGGIGLETFYGRLGWKETGRWPGALRLADGKDHDEVLMLLTPL